MKFNSTESFSYDNKKGKQMQAIKGKCLIRSQSTHKVMSAAEKKRKYFSNNTMFEVTFLSINSFSTMSKNGPQLIKYSCENSIVIYQITLELKVNTPNEITSQKYEKIKVHTSQTGGC